MQSDGKRSPWIYVGIGCGALVLLVVLAVVAVSVIGVRTAKRFKAEMADPATRSEKVKAALGAEKLPEGYHAMLALELPFVFELSMLTDRPPTADGKPQEPKERLFVYVRVLRSDARAKQQYRDYLEGRSEEPQVFASSNMQFDSHEVIRRGAAEVQGIQVPYSVQRGTLRMEQQNTMEGLVNLMMFDCPEDPKLRMGVWIGPDVVAEEGSAEVDLRGTPADEAAMVAFLEHFSLCGTGD